MMDPTEATTRARKRHDFCIRYAASANVLGCQDVDHAAGVYWPDGAFRRALSDSRTVFKVALLDSRVVGYIVWELETHGAAWLKRLVVTPMCRQLGIGSVLVLDQMRKLGVNIHRTEARAAVLESNLDCQMFLRSMGWVADRVAGGEIRFLYRAEWRRGDGW